MSAQAGEFDALYADADPFCYRTRWYEARKRALLLALLPRAMFDSAWEFGCSNGETTAELAYCCTRLLATDFAERAVALARTRVATFPHVSVQRAEHPREWPEGRFDLIVFSEVGYYLDDDALARSIDGLARSLTPDGVLIACHWLAPFAQARRSGACVHDMISTRLPLPHRYAYRDDDFILDGWSGAALSIAQAEGLR